MADLTWVQPTSHFLVGQDRAVIVVSTIQMESRTFEVEQNLERAGVLLADSARQRPDLVLLPELFHVGYCYDSKMLEFAEELDGRTVKWLRRSSLRHGCYIGGCIIERDGKDVFNTFVMAGPTGELHTYRKRHLPFYEKLYFTAGQDEGIFDTPLGRIGVLICWDMVHKKRVKELVNKVDLLLISSAWPDLTTGNVRLPFFQSWMTRQVHRQPSRLAKQLQVPVVFSNHTGTFETRFPYVRVDYRSQFAGHSGIHDRDGTMIRRLPWGDAAVSSEIYMPMHVQRRIASA